MASNIVSTTIDATFPTPGVDNDTQGFRDNFSIIKNNFAAAKAEIDVLQENTARLDQDSNFNGNSIISAKFQGSGDAFSALPAISNPNPPLDPLNPEYFDTELPWSEASYYSCIISDTDNAEFTLQMIGWPATSLGLLGKMVIQVKTTVDLRKIKFETYNNSIIGVVKLPAGVDNPVTLSIGTTNIYEFWTIDGGTTVYGRLVGSYT